MFSSKSFTRRAGLAGVTLATAILVGWTACSRSPQLAGSMSKVGGNAKEAPDFELKDIDGHLVRLRDYRGKVVLLDFWATWCGPCKVEIPWFEDFERRYKDRGLVVLGVAEDDDGWTVVKPFFKQMNMNYRVVLGDDKTADQYGGLEALPTTLLIDRDGQITATHVGLTSRKDFEDAIEQLLQKPAQVRASRATPDGAASVGPNGAAPHDL